MCNRCCCLPFIHGWRLALLGPVPSLYADAAASLLVGSPCGDVLSWWLGGNLSFEVRLGRGGGVAYAWFACWLYWSVAYCRLALRVLFLFLC